MIVPSQTSPRVLRNTHSVDPVRKFHPRPIVKLPLARLYPQPGILRIEPFRVNRNPPGVRPRCKWPGLDPRAPLKIEREPDAQRPSPGTCSRAPSIAPRSNGTVRARARPLKPREMPSAANNAPIPASKRLDQPEIVWNGAAKRAFHNASSYSDRAVESATTPPPTFNTAVPSGKSVRVRIATLNSARPSGPPSRWPRNRHPATRARARE